MSEREVKLLARDILLTIVGIAGDCTSKKSAAWAWDLAERFAAEAAKRSPATLPGDRP